jgi:hypothetical protein
MKRFNPMYRPSPVAPPSTLDPRPSTAPVQPLSSLTAPPPPKRLSTINHQPSTPTTITLTLNKERGLVELRFPGKPDDDTRSEMKSVGWRWYGPAGCWYHKNTPENLDWAEAFVVRQRSAVRNQQSEVSSPPSGLRPPTSVVPPAPAPLAVQCRHCDDTLLNPADPAQPCPQCQPPQLTTPHSTVPCTFAEEITFSITKSVGELVAIPGELSALPDWKQRLTPSHV